MNYIDHLKIKGVLYLLLDPSVDEKIRTAILNLIGTAPTTLDTLQEIALAILSGDSRVEAILTTLGSKADIEQVNQMINSISLTPGPEGLQGPQGKSAYEIYVDSLPAGQDPMTLEAWLASLKGPKGDTGEVDITNFYNKTEIDLRIPTKTSDLTNDSGFLTQHLDISNLATKSEVETNFENVYTKAQSDAKYLTEHLDLSTYAKKAELITEETINSKIASSIAEVVANAPLDLDTLKEVSDYIAADKTKASLLESAISALLSDKANVGDSYTKTEADNKFLTEHQSLATYVLKTELTTALLNKADKSELFSGNYNDLTNKPTNVSEFTNDAGYLTLHQDISNLATKTEVSEKIGNIGNVTVKGFVESKITEIVGAAPSTLDTLEEIATWILDDTSGAAKMVNDLANKVDKETGKGLSSNDYTNNEKSKLENIEAGAQVNVKPNWNAESGSTSEILNKPNLAAIATSGDYSDLINKPTIPSTLENLTDDSTHRLVTDTEKTTWNSKQDVISDLTNIRSGAAAGATALLSETDPTVPAWAKASTKPSYTAEEVGALPANTIIQAKTKVEFETALNNGDVQSTSIAIIEDTDEIWTLDKYYQFIPSNGLNGLILVKKGNKSVWSSTFDGLEDVVSYGVEWEKNATSPVLTRIGNIALHKSLPIQSLYKGCVYDLDNKAVNYWLNANDWSLKADGTASVLDGTDGQVMVHTPKFYGKSGETNGKYWVRISTILIDPTWIEVPELYVGAYRSTVNNTNNKAASVVNTTSAYRGGGNRSANDEYLGTDPCKSDLGKPRTSVSRAQFRTWARNAGAELLSYEQYKWIFYWAYVIEYANFNCQAAYNAELTSDGLHQGGLGDGVTTWNGTDWSNYNGYYPLTPCGYLNEIGNFTGVKIMTAGTKEFSVPRWRGFDNPFGDIWTNLDGVIIQGDTEGNPKAVYTTTDPTKYGDTDTLKAQMTIAGHEIHQDDYTLEFDLGETAEIIPAVMGGNVTNGKCDYHYTGTKDTSLRTLLVGGHAYSGGMAGFGGFDSYSGVGSAHASIGSRFVVRV